MAITKNIIIGIPDVYNEPDAILIRSTENQEDINIQVVTSKFAVKREDLLQALKEVEMFVNKRQPLEIIPEFVPQFVYKEEN